MLEEVSLSLLIALALDNLGINKVAEAIDVVLTVGFC
jgi:hypothetical protein